MVATGHSKGDEEEKIKAAETKPAAIDIEGEEKGEPKSAKKDSATQPSASVVTAEENGATKPSASFPSGFLASSQTESPLQLLQAKLTRARSSDQLGSSMDGGPGCFALRLLVEGEGHAKMPVHGIKALHTHVDMKIC